ncbi:hypothetical protein BDF19DRAFT_412974 [Syncephalis fuscata]|nr:hypothetical protein BDF19DRAFT_412974 [Syncephalis fuscata]
MNNNNNNNSNNTNQKRFAHKRIRKPLLFGTPLSIVKNTDSANTTLSKHYYANNYQPKEFHLDNYTIPKRHSFSPRTTAPSILQSSLNGTASSVYTSDRQLHPSVNTSKQLKPTVTSSHVIKISSSESSSDEEATIKEPTQSSISLGYTPPVALTTAQKQTSPLVAVSNDSMLHTNNSPKKTSTSKSHAFNLNKPDIIYNSKPIESSDTSNSDESIIIYRRLRKRPNNSVNYKVDTLNAIHLDSSDETSDESTSCQRKQRIVIDESGEEEEEEEEMEQDSAKKQQNNNVINTNGVNTNDVSRKKESDNEEFEVEKILAKRTVKKEKVKKALKNGSLVRTLPTFPEHYLMREWHDQVKSTNMNNKRIKSVNDKKKARSSSKTPVASSSSSLPLTTIADYRQLLFKEQRVIDSIKGPGVFKVCEPYCYRNEKHQHNLRKIEELLASDLGPRLTVVNNVDDEGLLVTFQYINDLRTNDYLIELSGSDFMIGCSCYGKCSSSEKSTCDCLRSSDNMFAYLNNGKLRIDQGSAIYECSVKCGCSIYCPNRVVQRGRTVELQLFKTSNRGWGIRTMEDLPAGTYIERYLGEVITNEEAERRGHDYDDAGRTYLFDLDWHGHDTCKYVVDAYPCGNFTRFFNHSCDPNLMVIPVFINTWEATLHQLAFFTRRSISKFEELTFDYMGGVPIDNDDEDADEDEAKDDDSGDDDYQDRQASKPPSVLGQGPLSRDNNMEAVSAGKKPRAGEYPCLCGSHHCRKFVHF